MDWQASKNRREKSLIAINITTKFMARIIKIYYRFYVYVIKTPSLYKHIQLSSHVKKAGILSTVYLSYDITYFAEKKKKEKSILFIVERAYEPKPSFEYPYIPLCIILIKLILRTLQSDSLRYLGVKNWFL